MSNYVVNIYFDKDLKEIGELGFGKLKPVITYNGLTKIKAQDIFSAFKSNLLRGQDKFVAQIYRMMCAKVIKLNDNIEYKVFGIEILKRTNEQSFTPTLISSNFKSIAMIQGKCDTPLKTYDVQDEDFKFDEFKIKCDTNFEAKRDDVLYRRLDLAGISDSHKISMTLEEEIERRKNFTIVMNIKGKCYIEIDRFGDKVVTLQQHDNVPRQFKITVIPLSTWNTGEYAGNGCKGCSFKGLDVLNAYLYHKDKGIFDFYVEYRDKKNVRKPRQLFIGETVKHYKGDEYLIFDFVYNATTDDIDVLYVKKKQGGTCSNIQFTRNYKEFLSHVEYEGNQKKACNNVSVLCSLDLTTLIMRRFQCDYDIMTGGEPSDELLSLISLSSNSTNYDNFVGMCIELNKQINFYTRHKLKSHQDIYLYRL